MPGTPSIRVCAASHMCQTSCRLRRRSACCWRYARSRQSGQWSVGTCCSHVRSLRLQNCMGASSSWHARALLSVCQASSPRSSHTPPLRSTLRPSSATACTEVCAPPPHVAPHVRSLACKPACMQVSGRRLQSHGGSVHAKGLIPAPLPAWLAAVCARLHAAVPALYGHEAPNHVLVNEYQPGEGIMVRQEWHGGQTVLGQCSDSGWWASQVLGKASGVKGWQGMASPLTSRHAGRPRRPVAEWRRLLTLRICRICRCMQAHEDGPAYHPGVVILSLASPAILRFWRKADDGGEGRWVGGGRAQ